MGAEPLPEIPPPPHRALAPCASPEEIAFFRENGFLRVERITTDEELAWLTVVFDRLFAEGGPFPGACFDLARPYESAGDDLLPQVLFPERRYPEIRRTLWYQNGRRIAAALLGAEPDALESWGHLILKPARRGHETPWHQDEAYWEPDRRYRALGLWLPLEGASVESGCLHFVPGSHRLPVLPHRHLYDDPSVHALLAPEVDGTGGVPVPVPAGGATFHHSRTLHYAGPNRTHRHRRACATEFQLPPEPCAAPAERPWLAAGREAWARRRLDPR